MDNTTIDFLEWKKKHAYVFTKPLKDEESIDTLKTQMHLEKFILEMIDWRRKQIMMGNPAGGVTPSKTVTVREHGNRGISIDVSEKNEIKDITPKK